MRNCLLVHGFNVKDGGRNSTDKLRPYFEYEGYNVMEADYTWTGLIGVRLCNKKMASIIANMSKGIPKLVAVGHSNGCAILRKALEMGGRFDQLVFINPALNRKAKFGRGVNWVHVWHSRGDAAVTFARFLPKHAWGDMGSVGYKGKDPRVVNYDKSDGKTWSVRSVRHSDVFKPNKLPYFGPKIVYSVEHIREHGKPWSPQWDYDA